jgi:benzoyl-CoA reductase/2-hydroxyglutaryl-CoA dehydratase subunit BcrC/BadD/HgdB
MSQPRLARPWYLSQGVGHLKQVVQMAECNPGAIPGPDLAFVKLNLAAAEKVEKAVEGAQPFVWLNISLPTEPFLAMDLPYLHIGDYMFSAIGAGRIEAITEALDLAESIGSPSTACAFYKIPIGAIAAGQYPTPSVMIAGSHPCQQAIAGWEVMGELVKAPIFYFEPPTRNDEATVDYLAEELQRMIGYLEKHTGKKMEVDRLREVVEESNQAQELSLEVSEMRKAVPCPLKSSFLNLTSGGRWHMGMPETTALFREMHFEAVARIKRGDRAVPQEKFRVLWYDLGVLFTPIYDWLEKEWGAVVAMDLTSYNPEIFVDASSYESMLKGLGRRFLNYEAMQRVNHGLAVRFIDEFVRVYSDYKCNLAVYSGHYADKGRPVLLSILKEVCRERGIPLLALPFDSFDPRVVSEKHIQDKISQFFSTIELL